MKVDVKIEEAPIKTEKKVVAVQIPFEVYEQLKSEAEEDYISVSDVTRRIIIRHYREKKNTTM